MARFWKTFVGCLVASLLASATFAYAQPTAKKEDDWAKDVLKSDPLSKKDNLSIDDLRAAIQDARQAEFAIERHFGRAELSREQRREFLREALQHPSPKVRQQAVVELKRFGLLDEVLSDSLAELLKNEDIESRMLVVLSLRNANIPWSEVSQQYWKAIVEALAFPDEKVRDAALVQIEGWGASAIPSLLDALRSPDKATRVGAANAMSVALKRRPSDIGPLPTSAPDRREREAPVDGTRKELPGPPSPKPPAPVPTVAKGGNGDQEVAHVNRQVDEKHPELIRVYYGTNREVVKNVPDPRFRLLIYPAVFLVLLYLLTRRREATSGGKAGAQRHYVRAFLGTTAIVVGLVWLVSSWNNALRTYLSEPIGVVYGSRRDHSGGVHFGYCDVSIPPGHVVGQIEQPMFGAEDEERHVMIRRNEELVMAKFYDELRRAIDAKPIDHRDCFVFVHGYNVTFENAARRTAQIHFDLKFSGVPIFYSWPSRGHLRSYFSDRNEIGYSYEHIKTFLMNIGERIGARRVHVIAHSMGADAVGRAILAMGNEGKKFDQIILAAPDIDADVFRQQIAPRMLALANRTTLYCSRNDWALHASYAFNDSPRLGDSSRGITVVDGVDTVDASAIDTDLLGHSYYGDCLKLIDDVQLLVEKNLAPPERKLASVLVEALPYWTFPTENP